MIDRGFATPLAPDAADELRRLAHEARGHILTATTLAASGHPGGSMSSIELYTVLWNCARLRPAEPTWPERDRIVVSHGHTSPGAYAALALAGYFPVEELVAHFRQCGAPFEGHLERSVTGVEWSTGNLGQGLSAGVGFALGARLTGTPWHTFVVMSDGEQMKGQVGEARRLASKERLDGLTVLVDLNGIQISGRTADVMPVRVAEDFAADGWRVIEVADGHDVEALHAAVGEAVADPSGPAAIIAHTVIGKGVSFMEGVAEFHGRGLKADEYVAAMAELGLDAAELERARERRPLACVVPHADITPGHVRLAPGTPRTYDRDKDTDCRSAWGTALTDLAEANPDTPMAVLDCDLAVSVKTEGFAALRPDAFVECGVGEHNAAVVAAGLSISGVAAFWSDFGVFGIDEVYNQHRLSAINGASPKVVLTHCGLDVGEDGRTHHCIDHVGALRNMFGWRVAVPADPNQTDRAVRWAAGEAGCVAVAMGRSKVPVVLGTDGSPLFGGAYRFRYGEIVRAREGGDACVLAMGQVAAAAVDAADALAAEGIACAVDVVACPLELDDAAMERACAAPLVVTVEDHNVRTGLAASVAEWVALRGRAVRLVRIGVEAYASSGTSADLLAAAGLDASGIAATVRSALGV